MALDALQARLVFHIAGSVASQVANVISRLKLDYSAPDEILRPDPANAWFIAQATIYLEEFATVISYMRRLERLYPEPGDLRITPLYLTDNQLTAAAALDDTHAIYVGPSARVKLVACRKSTADAFELCGDAGGLNEGLLPLITKHSQWTTT